MLALSKYHHYPEPRYELPDHLKHGVVYVRFWLDAGYVMNSHVSFMPTTGPPGGIYNVDPDDVRELFATTDITVHDFLRRIYRYSIASRYSMDTEDWTLVIAKKDDDTRSTSYKIVAADYLFVHLPAMCMSQNSERFKLTILTQPFMLENIRPRREPGILQRGDTSYFGT